MSTKGNVLPQFLGSGDPALKNYYPAWVNNMADDATVEGSMLNGVVRVGTPSGQSCSLFARYTNTRNSSSPAPTATTASSRTTSPGRRRAHGCVVLVTRNAGGRPARRRELPATQLAAALFPLLREKFAGTPMPSTSPPASPQANRNKEMAMRV